MGLHALFDQLVETEQRRVASDLCRCARDRIGCGLATPLDRLMRLRHEFLEVHAALRRVMNRLEEEIEQHGLAASHPAIEVEPLRRRPSPPREGEQIVEPRLAILRKAVGQELEHLGRELLRGVGEKLALEHHLPVALERSILHGLCCKANQRRKAKRED